MRATDRDKAALPTRRLACIGICEVACKRTWAFGDMNPQDDETARLVCQTAAD